MTRRQPPPKRSGDASLSVGMLLFGFAIAVALMGFCLIGALRS